MRIAINQAAKDWGLTCLRYEIRDINPPAAIKMAMEMQAEAERKKRASIFDSEAERQAQINVAEGKKTSVMLEAQAQAEAILVKAQATNKGLTLISQSIKENGGAEVSLLGRLHHRNLVNLVGYCAEKGQHMLIYVYMSKGSLSSHLYNEKHDLLSWSLRVQIALDVARGLECLHDGVSNFNQFRND